MTTSRSLNKAMIIGNLTRDPEIRTVGERGSLVCTFGVATNTTWRNSDGEIQERTEFHNIVAWNKLGEICAQILSKGMLVYLEGEIRTRSWETSEGFRRYKAEVKLNDMKLLDAKGKQGVGIEEARTDNNSDEDNYDDDEEDSSDDQDSSDTDTEEDGEDLF